MILQEISSRQKLPLKSTLTIMIASFPRKKRIMTVRNQIAKHWPAMNADEHHLLWNFLEACIDVDKYTDTQYDELRISVMKLLRRYEDDWEVRQAASKFS